MDVDTIDDYSLNRIKWKRKFEVNDDNDGARTTLKFPRKHNDEDDIHSPLKIKINFMMMNDLKGQNNT